MSPNEYLCAAGAALYGARWQTALAEALAVNPRTVRRWAVGEMPVPPGIWAELRPRLADRLKMLDAELARLAG